MTLASLQGLLVIDWASHTATSEILDASPTAHREAATSQSTALERAAAEPGVVAPGGPSMQGVSLKILERVIGSHGDNLLGGGAVA